MSPALLVAIGNPLRGDDGVASEVLRLLKLPEEANALEVHQLTPEIAATMSHFGKVVFIDASFAVDSPRLTKPDLPVPSATLGHTLHPAELVLIAQRVSGFVGRAYLLEVPVEGTELGAPLSSRARAGAVAAAELLARSWNEL